MEEFSQIHILLIEDNPLDAELTMHGLRIGNVSNHITWLKDGEEALDYLFRRGHYAGRDDSQPGLILLDLNMPRMGGAEVLTALKADPATRRIPVVVMTASREERDVARSYDLGANSYVAKPVDFEGMSEVAREAGFYWMMVNRHMPH